MAHFHPEIEELFPAPPPSATAEEPTSNKEPTLEPTSRDSVAKEVLDSVQRVASEGQGVFGCAHMCFVNNNGDAAPTASPGFGPAQPQ